MYAVGATIARKLASGDTVTHQIPTFYLDENVQGITDDRHAAEIAREIVEAFPINGCTYFIAVEQV